MSTSDEFGTLFRSNSMASKMIKFYCKMVGQKYLQSLFVPIIKKLSKINLEV